jgi:hypothetical protein
VNPGRPKSRLQKLAVFFTPSASLTPPRMSKQATNSEDAYLESQEPLPANLLQALAEDPYFAKSQPYLPASRFSKSSTPVPLGRHRAIHGGPRKLFRAIPAFLWRIRFLRYPGLSEKEAILSALDIEVAQLAGSNVSIDKIIMQLSSGMAESLGVELPHQCQPGEQLTLIYKIHPPPISDKSKDENASRTLGITLSASVLISSTCVPKVKIKWKTFLEMPQSRPTSNAGPAPPIGEVTEIGHDTLTMTTQVAEVEAKPTILPGLGITVVAPDRIFAGEPFAWEVLVVNRSDKTHRLAIVPVQKRHGEMGSRPNSMAGLSENTASTTSPSLDEQALHSLIRASSMDATELVCLSPDVRIG